MIDASDVQRLMLGHYTFPEKLPGWDKHPLSGQQIVVTGFLIRHPRGPFLFDTGFGETADEAAIRYKVIRRDVTEALAKAGIAPRDVKAIANCHLHFDHGGGNSRFPGTTVVCQKSELDHVHDPNYTIPAEVIDYRDAHVETLDGEGVIAPGLLLIPTPGHTQGHQSLVIEAKQGRIILAGQASYLASEHAMERYARELAQRGEPHADYHPWMDRFAELDPWRVLFAHDLAIWERPSQ